MCCVILHNLLIKNNFPINDDDIAFEHPDVELVPPIDIGNPIQVRQMRQNAVLMRREEAETLVRRLQNEEN